MNPTPPPSSHSKAGKSLGFGPRILATALLAPAVLAGCATTLTVLPGEVPGIQEQLEADPGNPELLTRLALGLFARDDCERAAPVAQAALAGVPSNEIALLVAGECLERDGQYDEALSAYQAYLSEFGSDRGALAIGARAEIAARGRARALAVAAVERETTVQAEDAEATGVLPLLVVGDAALQPLSMGLAYMITTDLTLLERFRVVERLEIDALFDEMALSTTDRVDPDAAVRLGRMSGAGRLLQGSLVGQPDETASLNASVALANGEVVEATPLDGPLEDLLDLEKELVISLAEDLGYVLTDAERQRILANGPRNLKAFLAFSDGLVAEGQGLFAEAVDHYGAAARADPRFVAARRRLRLTTAVTATQNSGGQPGTVVDNVNDAVSEEERGSGVDSQLTALSNSILDLTGHQSERVPLTGDPIDSVVDPKRGPEFTSFVIDLLLRIPIPGR